MSDETQQVKTHKAMADRATALLTREPHKVIVQSTLDPHHFEDAAMLVFVPRDEYRPDEDPHFLEVFEALGTPDLGVIVGTREEMAAILTDQHADAARQLVELPRTKMLCVVAQGGTTSFWFVDVWSNTASASKAVPQ